jgi:hypothetical protein
MIVYLCSLYANSLKPVVDIDYSVDKISLSLLVYYTQWRVQGGPPRPRPPMAGRQNFFSLVPILNRYARPGLTILNSKFHRIGRFEQYNFGQFLSKVNSFLYVEVCFHYRTCRELLAVRTIVITFQLEHQKNTAGVRSPCRILHSSFQKFSLAYTPIPMAGGECNRITPSIIFFNLNLQLEGVCTSNYKSSRHKI